MKTILVTGASSGIGQALVKQLASQDTRFLLIGRDQERLQQLIQTIVGKHQVILIDLKDLTEVQKLPTQYQIDCLINCAGVGEVGSFQELSLEQELAEIEINFLAPLILSKGYAQQFIKQQQGTILNVCSTSAFHVHPYLTTYGASKAALWQYSLGLTEELRVYPHVRVVTVCPGPTKTSFFKGKMQTKIQENNFQMTPEKVAMSIIKVLKTKKNYQIIGYRNWWMTWILGMIPMRLRLIMMGTYIKRGRIV